MNKEFLEKIYNLALRGAGGEKENAQKILDKLLKKYSMTIEELQIELDKEEIINLDIKANEEETRILVQVAYKVLNDREHIYDVFREGKKVRKLTRIKCTAKQSIEIEFLYSFYKELWYREKRFFLSAFIQKHKLFGELKEDEEGSTISDEDWLKMKIIMKGMSDELPVLQIEGGAENEG